MSKPISTLDFSRTDIPLQHRFTSPLGQSVPFGISEPECQFSGLQGRRKRKALRRQRFILVHRTVFKSALTSKGDDGNLLNRTSDESADRAPGQSAAVSYIYYRLTLTMMSALVVPRHIALDDDQGYNVPPLLLCGLAWNDHKPRSSLLQS